MMGAGILRCGLVAACLVPGCATPVPDAAANGPPGPAETRAADSTMTRRAFQRMLMKEYPKDLLEAGIGGTTVVELLVDEGGSVREAGVLESSGYPALDEVAVRVAPLGPFLQPLRNGRPMKARVRFPVVFNADTAASQPCEGPSVKPKVLNRHTVQQALVREYPARLRDRRIGGVVELVILIDESGRPVKIRFEERSGQAGLDDAARRVGWAMRFSPALDCGEPVPVWSLMPITFRLR